MGHEKPIYRGELPKRKRLGEFADLRENLVKKRSGCDFEGGVIPQYTIFRLVDILKSINKVFKNNFKEIHF